MASRQPYKKPALVFNNHNIHVHRSVIDAAFKNLNDPLYISYSEEANVLVISNTPFDCSDEVWAKPSVTKSNSELYTLQSNGKPRKNLINKKIKQDIDVAIRVNWI